MPISYELCACGVRYTIPSGWTGYWCGVCQKLFWRDGGLFYPTPPRAKVG